MALVQRQKKRLLYGLRACCVLSCTSPVTSQSGQCKSGSTRHSAAYNSFSFGHWNWVLGVNQLLFQVLKWKNDAWTDHGYMDLSNRLWKTTDVRGDLISLTSGPVNDGAGLPPKEPHGGIHYFKEFQPVTCFSHNNSTHCNDKRSSAACINVSKTSRLWATGWCDWKCRYRSVHIYIIVEIRLTPVALENHCWHRHEL